MNVRSVAALGARNASELALTDRSGTSAATTNPETPNSAMSRPVPSARITMEAAQIIALTQGLLITGVHPSIKSHVHAKRPIRQYLIRTIKLAVIFYY